PGYECNGTQCRAEGERADVTHENLRRIGVEPEKSKPGTGDRTAYDAYFTDPGYIRYAEILGEPHMARGVCEHRQRRGHHNGRQYRQPVQSVGEIHRIA